MHLVLHVKILSLNYQERSIVFESVGGGGADLSEILASKIK